MATKARPIFDPKVFLATADSGRTISKYRVGQVIFEQGRPADSVFFIEKGKAKVTVVSKQGKEAIVAFLGAENFLGEGCLRGQPRRMATATAVTECQITRVDKSAMIKILHDEPKMSELLIEHLLAR